MRSATPHAPKASDQLPEEGPGEQVPDDAPGKPEGGARETARALIRRARLQMSERRTAQRGGTADDPPAGPRA